MALRLISILIGLKPQMNSLKKLCPIWMLVFKKVQRFFRRRKASDGRVAQWWLLCRSNCLRGEFNEIFQEEIFGPVVSATTFKDEAEALSIANDTLYGLGAGVWSRDANTCYRMGRGIQAGEFG